jgi:hypothetical protein
MTVTVSERSFEEAIECGFPRGGPDACAGNMPVVREEPQAWGDAQPSVGAVRRTTTARSTSCRATPSTSLSRRSRRSGRGSPDPDPVSDFVARLTRPRRGRATRLVLIPKKCD